MQNNHVAAEAHVEAQQRYMQDNPIDAEAHVKAQHRYLHRCKHFFYS